MMKISFCFIAQPMLTAALVHRIQTTSFDINSDDPGPLGLHLGHCFEHGQFGCLGCLIHYDTP